MQARKAVGLSWRRLAVETGISFYKLTQFIFFRF
jgi:hypothetical protein